MRDLSPRPGDLDPVETASVDEIRALHLGRLQRSLRHAHDHVPHRRAAVDALGAHPRDLRALEDLARSPSTTKADLRGSHPFGMPAVPRGRVSRLHASSGATGQPTAAGCTPQLSPHFPCVLVRPGRVDELVVRVERRAEHAAEAAADAGELLSTLVKHTVGVTVGVEVVDPGTIERSAGTMRRIVDRREERTPR